jgi:hypothetical protein
MSYPWRHKPQQWPIISRHGWCIGGAVLCLLSSILPYANDNLSQSILQRAASGEQPSEPLCLTAAAPSDRPRWSDYLRLKHRTWAWFDQLDVDPVELLKHGVKGKKKLAEILQAYLNLYQHAPDAAARERIQQRVVQLVRHTQRSEYHHDLLVSSDTEFLQNSMSYLRVLWLLEHLEQDTTAYRQRLLTIKPRMDEHLKQRGPWQQAMFAEYYTRFGLEKPPGLSLASAGVVIQRLPLTQYNRDKAYYLTHEVFVAFDYGLRRLQSHFTAEDLSYIRTVLPVLAQTAIQQNAQDLLAEILQCMTYLGWQTEPVYCQGINYLLDSQNPNGTWGNYEALRTVDESYFDQRLYLHTTMVAMQALSEAYEGHWPLSE